LQSTAHRWGSSTSSAWISQPLIPARALLTPPSGDARKILRERSSREEVGRSATRPERAQGGYDVEAVRGVRAGSQGRLARRVAEWVGGGGGGGGGGGRGNGEGRADEGGGGVCRADWVCPPPAPPGSADHSRRSAW